MHKRKRENNSNNDDLNIIKRSKLIDTSINLWSLLCFDIKKIIIEYLLKGDNYLDFFTFIRLCFTSRTELQTLPKLLKKLSVRASELSNTTLDVYYFKNNFVAPLIQKYFSHLSEFKMDTCFPETQRVWSYKNFSNLEKIKIRSRYADDHKLLTLVGLYDLPKLVEINTNTQIEGGDYNKLTKLTSLESLTFRGNKLSFIPPKLNLTKLKVYCSLNNTNILQSIPNVLSLKELHLVNLQTGYTKDIIDGNISNLTNLTCLHIKKHSMEHEIPYSISKLTNLNDLKYHFVNPSNYEDVVVPPPGVLRLVGLTSLELNYIFLNRERPLSLLTNLKLLKSFDSIQRMNQLNGLTKLESLYVISSKIKGITPGNFDLEHNPGNFKNLTNLWIESNSIACKECDVQSLKHVKKIKIYTKEMVTYRSLSEDSIGIISKAWNVIIENLSQDARK